MSEIKPISPLLDGYSMGAPMSNHDGVACIPAIKDNSDDKYIIKVISIPASQVQLDALLLAGAYKDAASAMDYFRELSEGVIREAECLKKLSKLEGFLPFENWQVVPMETGKLGYQVYLLGTYKHSLERYIRRNNMSHLASVNLGLDMCAALAVARQAGWIYVDLKPSNIFLTSEREYRIGDLGFMALDSLKYAALPSKYRSPYNAPELSDPLATPNETIDTYAVGMILYQIYNNGIIPHLSHPTEEELPAPANADYELAEIILKACAPNPKDRWTDPVEMGQALVAYMQRNIVNDTPVLPPVVSVDDTQASPSRQLPALDETLPGIAEDAEIPPESLSEEMSAILDRADELISGTAPEKLTAESTPEETAKEESTPDNDTEPNLAEPAEAAYPYQHKPENSEIESLTDPDKKHRARAWFLSILTVLVLAAGAAGYWLYENYYLQTIDALQVEGAGSEMTVLLDTPIDNSLLTVICTDTYGNTSTCPVADGKAHFTGLLPDMLYKVRVEIEGFHKLKGSTTHEFTTPTQTSIVSFTAVTGPEDGSVILNFTIDGPDSEEWIIAYNAADEEARSVTFTGHNTTITGLTVGKQYVFSLGTEFEQTLIGDDTVTFTASKIVYAENVAITAANAEALTVSWTAPADTAVDSWNVHCYNGSGYDKMITTSELNAVFEGIDLSSAYTVEVTAAGMTQPVRTGITANPINITAVNVDASKAEQLTVTWDFDGNAPIGGWLLMYNVDGSTRQEVVQCDTNSAVIEVRIPGAAYNLSIEAADGTSIFGNTYSYTCPNAQVYQNTAYGIYARHIEQQMDVHLLATPENPNWSYKNVNTGHYTNTFRSGQGISVLLYVHVNFYLPRDNTSILYVIRDSEGKVLSELTAKETRVWYDMWWNTNYHYCELNVPNAPTAPGDYTLSIYFNGMAIMSSNFTITE